MKSLVRMSAIMAVALGAWGAPAQAASPAPALPATVNVLQSDPALTQARHLWPGNPVCRRLRMRGWRYNIWEARAAYRRHCRGGMRGPGVRGPGARGPETGAPPMRRVGRRECRRLQFRGWQRGDRQARRRFRRFCTN